MNYNQSIIPSTNFTIFGAPTSDPLTNARYNNWSNAQAFMNKKLDPYEDFWDAYSAPTGATIRADPNAAGGLKGFFKRTFGGTDPATAAAQANNQAANAATTALTAPAAAGAGAGAATGLRGIFDRAKGYIGENFAWTPESGVKAFGHNVGDIANIGSALYGLYNIGSGAAELGKQREGTSDITNDILYTAMSNPYANAMLTADQQKTLRQIQRGTYDDSAGVDGGVLTSALGGAAKGAATGIIGGVPGMVIGALGGGLGNLVKGIGDSQADQNQQLEALYDALLRAQQGTPAMATYR